jgi:hypothetical protein
MRNCRRLLPLSALLLLVACDPGIGMTFENKTDALICWYQHESADGHPSGPCAEIEPGETIEYGTICTNDEDKTVILTAGRSGATFYNRTATCGDWDDSGARITIERDGEEFVATDSLAE